MGPVRFGFEERLRRLSFYVFRMYFLSTRLLLPTPMTADFTHTLFLT